MNILNENLNVYLHNDEQLNESPTPMWMSYVDAFNKFISQAKKRLDRYKVYDEMDKYPEIHLALDIISTEMYSFDYRTKSPFIIGYISEKDSDSIELPMPEKIFSQIQMEFSNRFKLKQVLPFATRLSLKYGDAFYFVLKDEKGKLAGLRRIPESEIDFIEYDQIGVEPINYYIKKEKVEKNMMNNYIGFLRYQGLNVANGSEIQISGPSDEYYVIPAERMVRFMNKGENSMFFPFGESYLEPIFPYWKKVTLLEDSLIIYRIVRAPERRVFYIDVGKAPPKIAQKVIEETKEEIRRRRVAASQESSELGITSQFNPLSMQEDYFFAQRSDGRGSRVETLPGASNLGEISDVSYFYKKLINSLRIPVSYLNTENPTTFNDGKVGSAFVEEIRFGKWLSEIRDQYLDDFKRLFLMFLNEKGIKIDEKRLVFKWRESIDVEENQELDKMAQRQSILTGFPSDQFAPTFLQRKILGWSDEEIQQNLTELMRWNKLKAKLEENQNVNGVGDNEEILKENESEKDKE